MVDKIRRHAVQEFKRQRRLRRVSNQYLKFIRARKKKEIVELPKIKPKLSWWKRLLGYAS